MVRYIRRLYVHTSLCCILSGSIPVRNADFGEGSGSILLDNLVCEGDESSLLDCASDVAIGESNCQHSEDAGVRCEGTYVYMYLLYENPKRFYCVDNIANIYLLD